MGRDLETPQGPRAVPGHPLHAGLGTSVRGYSRGWPLDVGPRVGLKLGEPRPHAPTLIVHVHASAAGALALAPPTPLRLREP